MKGIFLIFRYLFLIQAALVCVRCDVIGYFYALEADGGALARHGLSAPQVVVSGGVSLHRIHLGEHEIWSVSMRPGNVATALQVQALLGRVKCDWLVSIGPAASISSTANPIGTWLRPNVVIPYQQGRYVAGGFEVAAPMKPAIPAIAVDPLLKALEAVDDAGLKVASGEVFVASNAERERIASDYEAQLLDMNSLGVVRAAAALRVPVLLLRVVSDHGDANAASDFSTFAKTYKGEGGEAVGRWLKELPASQEAVNAHPHLRKLLE